MTKGKTHIHQCKELYKQNEEWIKKISYIFGKSFHIYDQIVFEDFLIEYKRLKGRHSRNDYIDNLNMFLKLTFSSYCYGDMRQYAGAKTFWRSREESFNCFVGYLGSLAEANRYLESVDNIKSYT